MEATATPASRRAASAAATGALIEPISTTRPAGERSASSSSIAAVAASGAATITSSASRAGARQSACHGRPATGPAGAADHQGAAPGTTAECFQPITLLAGQRRLDHRADVTLAEFGVEPVVQRPCPRQFAHLALARVITRRLAMTSLETADLGDDALAACRHVHELAVQCVELSPEPGQCLLRIHQGRPPSMHEKIASIAQRIGWVRPEFLLPGVAPPARAVGRWFARYAPVAAERRSVRESPYSVRPELRHHR